MVQLEWVTIPQGFTLLGVAMSDEQARQLPSDSPEYPQERIELPEYHISKYPITVTQYRDYLLATSQTQTLEQPQFAGPGNFPVTRVTWHEALEFCTWLSQRLGVAVRLPTAAEWQKAARGTHGRTYPYGDYFDPQKANVRETGIGTLVPVDYFPEGASEYGVCDLSGNCWEWTLTAWQNRELKHENERLPTYAEYEDNSIRKGLKTICGGAYTTTERLSRAAAQYVRASNFTLGVQGFRVAYRDG